MSRLENAVRLKHCPARCSYSTLVEDPTELSLKITKLRVDEVDKAVESLCRKRRVRSLNLMKREGPSIKQNFYTESQESDTGFRKLRE